MAGPTPASVTDKSCTCGYLERSANAPDLPIVFDIETNEYHFLYSSARSSGATGKAYVVIYHCPFCGGAAPKSQRARLFTVIPAEEEHRLYALLNDVKTLDDAISVLGTPDRDDPSGSAIRKPEQGRQPPTIERFRTLTYTRLSDVAEVYIMDRPGQKVHVWLQGRYVGQAR